jgi:hypothetical protein
MQERGNCNVNTLFNNIQFLRNSENLVWKFEEKERGLYSEDKDRRERHKAAKTENPDNSV